MAINNYRAHALTGNSRYDDFIIKYRVRSVEVNRDYRKIDYYNKSAMYADREETLDIEMNRRAFEELVDMDRYAQEMDSNQRYENWMRKEHPVIKEAYEKYRMLLELYR
jgi:hypothetical protein